MYPSDQSYCHNDAVQMRLPALHWLCSFPAAVAVRDIPYILCSGTPGIHLVSLSSFGSKVMQAAVQDIGC